MRRSPNGFPHYRDRGYLLSQSLTKAFKARKLFPSSQHRIYSFRHSFEKRMLEAGLDYGLRCTLIGHRNPRPEYCSQVTRSPPSFKLSQALDTVTAIKVYRERL